MGKKTTAKTENAWIFASDLLQMFCIRLV